MIFDFSRPNIWKNAVADIVDSLFPIEAMRLISEQDPEGMYSDTMSFLVEALKSVGDDREYEDIVSQLDARFVEVFEEVKAFHGCRIVNEESYRSHGLRSFDRPLLREIALERLKDYVDPKKIESACDNFDIPKGRHGVYFFLCLGDAKLEGQNHYSKCGSEALHGLMQNLRLGSKGILSKQGKPCVIEFDIPSLEIREAFRCDLWRTFVTIYFQEAAGDRSPKGSEDWGFATSGGVAPQRIREFHYLDDSKLKLVSPLH